MSKIEEIERIIEQLPQQDFDKLSAWVEQQRHARTAGTYSKNAGGAAVIRDHSAFLNGYSSQDEGLYDDASGR